MDQKFPGSFIVGRFDKWEVWGGGNKLPMNPTNLTHLTPMTVQKAMLHMAGDGFVECAEYLC